MYFRNGLATFYPTVKERVGLPAPFANAPFRDNQQSSAFHPVILDILILALTMCRVLSAWDLKIHCCI